MRITISSFSFLTSFRWTSFISPNSLANLVSFSSDSLLIWSISSYNSTLSLLRVYNSYFRESILSSKAYTYSFCVPECLASMLSFYFGADCRDAELLCSTSMLNFGWSASFIFWSSNFSLSWFYTCICGSASLGEFSLTSLNLKTVSRHRLDASITCKLGSLSLTFYSGFSIICYICSCALFFKSSFCFSICLWSWAMVCLKYCRSFSKDLFLVLTIEKSSSSFFSLSVTYADVLPFSVFFGFSYYDLSEKVTFLNFNLFITTWDFFFSSNLVDDLSDCKMGLICWGGSDTFFVFSSKSYYTFKLAFLTLFCSISSCFSIFSKLLFAASKLLVKSVIWSLAISYFLES